MHVQTACQVPSATELRRPNCPHCGSTLLVAEQSAFNLNGRIRHTWSCDDCGHEFVTSIRVLPRRTASEGPH
jgi:RNase P subunit RPR2